MRPLIKKPAETEGIICPNCEKTGVVTRHERQVFVYGTGSDAVELSAEVPVRACRDCGFEFTDDDADEIRDEAIRRYLDVHSPQEVVAIRDKYELSRADFASLTGFGTASLARWESGTLIQNAANDRYLYLLSFRDNIDRLRARFNRVVDRIEAAAAMSPEEQQEDSPIFRALVNVRLCRERSRSWRLRNRSFSRS